MPRELIAKDPGFYRGSLIQRGTTFAFFGEKTPKWAVEKGEKLPAPKAAAHPDTKPADARKAVKAKIDSLTGADQVV
jgi:hypothetical protein